MRIDFTRKCRPLMFACVSSIGAALLLMTAACGDNTEQPDAEQTEAAAADTTLAAGTSNTIIDLVSSESRFSILATALDSAGLTTTLQGPGPFTVFAPSNAAFEALPPGTLSSLLMPANRDRLRNLLMYHVVDGRLTAQDLQGRSAVTTLDGSDLSVSASGGRIMPGKATITQPDIAARNGLIHVIDAVLMPER